MLSTPVLSYTLPSQNRCAVFSKAGVYLFLALFVILALCAGGGNLAMASSGQITAEQALRALPPSIFENTGEYITEDEKQDLLDRGYIKTWVVVYSDADTLGITAIEAVDTKVYVRLFRAGDKGLIVLGAQTVDACAVELWEYDAFGGYLPAAGPESPLVEDFFTSAFTLPKDTSMTPLLCLDTTHWQLEAIPLFWNRFGGVDIPPTRKVFFTWNGTEYIKHLAP